MSKPYFPGQQPASCGHYYPDVLRLRDEKKPDGTMVRVIDCRYCGRYERLLDLQTLDKATVRELNKKGRIIGVQEHEIETVRQRELEKLAASEDKTKRSWTLSTLLEEAWRQEADSIELEYVPEGLEVTYIRGSLGMGEIVRNSTAASELIQELIERAHLEHQSRGKLTWEYGGKSYTIRVTEYDSFGETAYRLVLKKPRWWPAHRRS